MNTVNNYARPPQKKKGGWGCMGVIILIIAIVIIGNANKEPVAPLTPQEAYQEWIDSQFSGWDGSHPQVVRMVKEKMNDPDSFKHVETLYRDDGFEVGITVQMKFRGTNAYGGTVLQTVEGVVDYQEKMVNIYFK